VPAPTAYTVTAIASGIGANVSIGAGRVEVIGAELVSVSFSVAETGQLFTSSYHSVVEARGGISISASVYYTSLESHKTFPAGTTPEYIANDYAGTSTFVGVSIGPFSISGSEDNGWSTSGVSVGPGWGASLITGDVITTTYIDGSLKVVR
jgi:hypothetical protein